VRIAVDRTDEIFWEAAQLAPGPERDAYVAQACGEDGKLRARVEKLLSVQPRVDKFLERPFAGPAATVELPAVCEGAGSVLGPYKLLEQIGEGGFGLVFMAEQQHPVRRKVAVKILKPGMDTRQVIARFDAERQALALMDHPNIARVLDAGTTEPIADLRLQIADLKEPPSTPQSAIANPQSAISIGRPYFVMELIKGVHITDYCDQNRLTPRQRLELFLTVCQAVQHAHQKGIIHRDIKPSNVMVTLRDEVPVVKVIDFGIAKALGQPLTDKTLVTGFAQMVGTPMYMSPEQAQASGLDIDTRSDIYSLGVLLYELLTGMTPFDKERLSKAGYDEMRRIIREEEPARPSTRLSTLGQAAATVSERRQSDPKRLSQLFRGELDWIVMKALEKDRTRRYETASAFAADVERYLKDEPVAACPPSPWYRLRKFSRRNRRALTTAAVVTAILALAGGSIGRMALERAARREETARQVQEAITTAHTLLDRNGPAQARQKLAEANRLMGADRAALAELAAQVDAFDATLDRLQRFLDLIERAHQAEIVNGTSQFANAVPFFLQALATYEVVEGADWCSRLDREQGLLGSEQVEQIRRIAFEKLLWLADDIIVRRRDHGTGQQLSVESAARRALAYLDKAEAAHPPIHTFYALRARCRRDLKDRAAARADEERALKTPPTTVVDHNAFGLTFYHSRKRTEAIRAFEAALRLEPTHFRSMMLLGASLCDLGQGAEDFRAAAIAFTGCILKRPDYAHAYQCRANAYTKLDRLDEALKDSSKAIELDPEHLEAWICRGNAYVKVNQFDKAVADYSKAIDLAPNNARAWAGRGYAYAQQGQWDKALADYSKAIALDDRLAEAWCDRGQAYAKFGNIDQALADCSKAIEVDEKLALAWSNRGGIYADLGRHKEALADLTKAIALDPKLALARYNRASVYRKLGEREKALADYFRSITLDAQFGPAWHSRGLLYSELGNGSRRLPITPEPSS